MSIDPFASLAELAAALARGEASALELAESYLERIRRLDPALHAYVHVDENLARRHARAADERRASGLRLGPLDGVPVALKDLLEIEGFPTGVGSALWKQRISTTTATVVRHLLAAGMVPLGKTHMVEFAFGTWGANPHLGTPRNPWDLATHRVPGGSSSGSGVAVAAGLAPAAIGSDTGGSVRIPAALNGITGLKTSGGLVSTEGAFPLSTTLDTIGPMTRSAADAALLAAAMLGDGAAARAFAALAASEPAASLAGVRIAVLPADQFPIAVEPEVAAAVEAAAACTARARRRGERAPLSVRLRRPDATQRPVDRGRGLVRPPRLRRGRAAADRPRRAPPRPRRQGDHGGRLHRRAGAPPRGARAVGRLDGSRATPC